MKQSIIIDIEDNLSKPFGKTKEAIQNAQQEDNKIKQSLILMCESLTIDENKLKCDNYNHHTLETVADFIGLDIK